MLLYDDNEFDDTKNWKILVPTIKLNSSQIHKGLMINFSDNLQACYAYAVIFICRFVWRLCYRIISLIKTLTFTFSFFISSIYLVRHCSILLRSKFCLYVNKFFRKKIQKSSTWFRGGYSRFFSYLRKVGIYAISAVLVGI